MFESLAAAGVTAVLLWLISRHVDLGTALGYWKHVHPIPVVCAIILFLGPALLAGSFKWYLLLSWKGMGLRYRDVLRVKVSAALFHVGLPFKIGALTEGLYLNRVHGCRLDHTLSTIAFDMLVNFMSLLVLATVGVVLANLDGGGMLGIPAWVWLTAGVGGILGILSPFTPPGLAVMERAAAVLPGNTGTFARGLLEGFRNVSHGRKLILMGLAIAMQAVEFSSMVFVMKAFDLDVPAGYLFIAVAIIFCLQSIPFTVSGFGTREWLMVYFFTRYRALMTPEQAVGVSMFIGSLVVVSYIALSVPFLPGFLHKIARGRDAADGNA